MTTIIETQGNIRTTMKYSSEWQEWQVRLWVNGLMVSTYFTNDPKDAQDTARLMRKEALDAAMA
jgi:phage portal protein BeeE